MNEIERTGYLLIVSGPSGTGKSTVSNQVLAAMNNLEFSVSCTTRSPRPGEQDGKDYFFVDEDEFKARIEADDFLEYANVHGNYYGTLKSEVIKKLEKGIDVLLDIDVQGAMKIREEAAEDDFLSKCVEFLFIGPPSFEELQKRLTGRGTEKQDVIETRLNNAKHELEYWDKYDYLIINDSVDEAICEMTELVKSLRSKTLRLKSTFFNG